MIFDAVASSGSVTAAADRLLISQPALSSQLKRLERSVGAPLFVRRPRGMELTDAGRVLADYARRIFGLADEAAAAVRDVRGLRRGTLRVGTSPAVGAYFLPPLLVHFQRRFPDVQLAVETAEGDALNRRVRDGSVDLALCPVPSDAADLRSDPFLHERFVAVAARDHPLARRRRPVTPDLLAAAFVGRQMPSATGGMTLGYFAGRGVAVRSTLSLGSVEAVKQAAVAGLGVTILSEMAVSAEVRDGRLRVLAVAGLPLRRPLYRTRRAGPESRAAVAFGCLLNHAARGTLPRLGPPASRP